MNRYESYKSSEIDWVGDIPSHWETVPPKYKLNRVTRPIDEDDEVITCFRDGVVTLRKNRREDGFTNSIQEHGYQQIHPGDLVVHEMDGFAGAIGISDSKGKSTPVYTVVQPDDRTNLRYIAYLLREMSQTGKIESLARSIRERTTDFRWNMWSVIDFPFPPVEEQKLISRYLDKKTEQIDSLVEKIQKKIELLKEQRTSLINHCVTKGLDPNVEMKDSGVEWIGEVPKNWVKTPLKYLFEYTKGKNAQTLTKEYILEHVGSFPVFSGSTNSEGVGSIDSYEFDYVGVIHVSTVGSEKIMSTQVIRGKFSLSQNCLIMIPRVDLNIEVIQKIIGLEFEQRKQQLPKILQLSFRFEDLDQISIFLPPLSEQNRIHGFLIKKLTVYENVVKLLKKQLELLSEYRQSLISSVVTGKVRVTEDMI